MNNIPTQLKKDLVSDSQYRFCMRHGHQGHVCDGRITFEHALIFAGKQVQAKFAILSICEYGHGVNMYQDGGDLNKELHVWIALNRASDEDIQSINKCEDYFRTRDRLNDKYGPWKMIYPKGITMVKTCDYPVEEKGINMLFAF